MTMTNGLAAKMVMFCRFDRASLPPVTNRTIAIRAVKIPHIAVTARDAVSRPNWLIVPITVEAESAEVMKKVASRIIAITEVIAPPGMESSRLNS